MLFLIVVMHVSHLFAIYDFQILGLPFLFVLFPLSTSVKYCSICLYVCYVHIKSLVFICGVVLFFHKYFLYGEVYFFHQRFLSWISEFGVLINPVWMLSNQDIQLFGQMK